MLFIFKGIATTARLLPEQQLRSDCKIFEDRFPRQYFGGVLCRLNTATWKPERKRVRKGCSVTPERTSWTNLKRVCCHPPQSFCSLT